MGPPPSRLWGCGTPLKERSKRSAKSTGDGTPGEPQAAVVGRYALQLRLVSLKRQVFRKLAGAISPVHHFHLVVPAFQNLQNAYCGNLPRRRDDVGRSGVMFDRIVCPACQGEGNQCCACRGKGSIVIDSPVPTLPLGTQGKPTMGLPIKLRI